MYTIIERRRQELLNLETVLPGLTKVLSIKDRQETQLILTKAKVLKNWDQKALIEVFIRPRQSLDQWIWLYQLSRQPEHKIGQKLHKNQKLEEITKNLAQM